MPIFHKSSLIWMCEDCLKLSASLSRSRKNNCLLKPWTFRAASRFLQWIGHHCLRPLCITERISPVSNPNARQLILHWIHVLPTYTNPPMPQMPTPSPASPQPPLPFWPSCMSPSDTKNRPHAQNFSQAWGRWSLYSRSVQTHSGHNYGCGFVASWLRGFVASWLRL